MTADRPATEPRTPADEWDALDRALLMCYGKPQGTNATAILRWLAQDGYVVVRAEAAQGAAPPSLYDAARAILPEVIDAELPSAITSDDPMAGIERMKAVGDRWERLRSALSEGAAPRAEGRRVCWSCEGEHDEMKHSLAATEWLVDDLTAKITRLGEINDELFRRLQECREGAAPRAEGPCPTCHGDEWISSAAGVIRCPEECWVPLAAPREGLDVERLRDAMDQHSLHDHESWDMEGCHPGCADQIAARLSRPSDERVPESEEQDGS